MDDDVNGIHSFFEDEYTEDFRRPKGHKKNFKHQKFHKTSAKQSSHHAEDDLDRYHNETARWEDEDDNHLIRPKERKNIFKDLQFLKKPTSAVDRSNLYKDIEFDNPQNTAARWEPPVDKPAVGNTTKLDASKLAPFEKDFYQLHPDTKNFTDVSIVLLLSSVERYFSATRPFLLIVLPCM